MTSWSLVTGNKYLRLIDYLTISSPPVVAAILAQPTVEVVFQTASLAPEKIGVLECELYQKWQRCWCVPLFHQ